MRSYKRSIQKWIILVFKNEWMVPSRLCAEIGLRLRAFIHFLAGDVDFAVNTFFLLIFIHVDHHLLNLYNYINFIVTNNHKHYHSQRLLH